MRRDMLLVPLAVGLLGMLGGGSPANARAGTPAAFGAVLPIAVSAREDMFPQVAWNAQCPAATQFLTVWQGRPADVGALSVYGRYTNNNVAALSMEYFIDGGVSGPSFTPNVAANTAAGAPQPSFLVVYEDDANGPDIYANLIDCNGGPVGGDILVTNDGALVTDSNPDVACGSTTCWVVWETFVAPNTRKVRASLISGGGVLGGSVGLSGASTTARAVSIANNQVNGCAVDSFLAVWQDRSAGSWDILGQELDGVGPCAATTTVAGGAGTNQQAPDAAFGITSGLYEVAWQDGGSVYAKVANADGSSAGARVNISVAGGPQADPAVAYDSVADRFLTVWEDRRNAGAGFDIWGQRTTGAGALMGGNFRFPSSNANGQNPSVAFSSGSARFYVNWDVDLDDVKGVGYL